MRGVSELAGHADWSQAFDDPISLPGRAPLTTLRQAGEYIAALPAREHNQPHWHTAMQHLISAAEDGGIVMLAEIAMRQALAHDRLRPEHAPRKKLAERYKASADTEPPVSRRARRLDASAVG
jgi:hypothetical protein